MMANKCRVFQGSEKERSHALVFSYPTQVSSHFLCQNRSCCKKLGSYYCFRKVLLIATTLNIIIATWAKEHGSMYICQGQINLIFFNDRITAFVNGEAVDVIYP